MSLQELKEKALKKRIEKELLKKQKEALDKQEKEKEIKEETPKVKTEKVKNIPKKAPIKTKSKAKRTYTPKAAKIDKKIINKIKNDILEELRKENENQIKAVIDLPDFSDIMSFVIKNYYLDSECKQYFDHAAPVSLLKEKQEELKIEKIRKGGGWSGAAKSTMIILRKMRKSGSF